MSYLVCRIGDHCQVGDGAHGSLKRVDEGVPYLTAKNLKEGRLELDGAYFIDEPTFSKHFKRDSKALTLPIGGDVIFGIIGSLGQAYRVKRGDRFGLSSSIAMLRPAQQSLEPDYLYYWVTGPEFQQAIYLIKGGVAQSYISLEMIRSLPLWLPSIQVQRKIATILSAYDDLIENNTRRIAILEEMASRLYEEWFVRFRFPGHEGVRMVESELGVVPQGWSVVPLETHYKTAAGGTPSREHPEYFGGDIKWVKTKELNDGFIFTTEESITGAGLSNSSAKVFARDTLLIAMYGATIGRLGILSTPAATNQACCAVMPVNSDYSLAYAYLTLLTRRQELIDLRTGAAQQNINQITIRKFPLLSPPLNILAAFNSIVQPMLRLYENLQSKNANLRTTRDLLLPKLISGELDVSTLPEPQAETA